MSWNKLILTGLCICIVLSANVFAGTHTYASTKVLIVVYHQYSDSENNTAVIASNQVPTIEAEVSAFREFVWRNSNLKLNLELTYLHIIPAIGRAALDANSNIHPDWVNLDLINRGWDPLSYDTIIAIYACPSSFSPDPGYCPCFVYQNSYTFISIPSGSIDEWLNNKLQHEYNHALDWMNFENGLSQYPCLHIPEYVEEGNTGAYSYSDLSPGIIRDWPVANWFVHPVVEWNTTCTAPDNDNDGLPDSGTDGAGLALAITESSLGSSTSNADTDSDGLTDYGEVMASYHTSSNPNDTDTDDDGLTDGQDEYPLYPVRTSIPKSGSVTLDGTIGTNEHTLVDQYTETTHTVKTYMDWDSSNLYISLDIDYSGGTIDSDNVIEIRLDKNADGLIQGTDNRRINIWPVNGIIQIEAFKLETGQWDKCDFQYTSHGITWGTYITNGKFRIELAIPTTSELGISLVDGKTFGVRIDHNLKGIRQDVFTKRLGENMEHIRMTLKDNSPSGGLKAQYKTYYAQDQSNQIGPIFNLINTGSESIDLSACKIRYHYTCETPTTQQFNCDYAAIGSSKITGQFVSVGSGNYYLEAGFTSAAGSLGANCATGEIQTRFNKTDWSNYMQSNDYSFRSDASNFIDYENVTVYYNGQLVWGTEPQ